MIQMVMELVMMASEKRIEDKRKRKKSKLLHCKVKGQSAEIREDGRTCRKQ